MMRFRKWPRFVAYEEAARKRSAFLAKQRHERDAFPLFAAAAQHSTASMWKWPAAPIGGPASGRTA